MKSKAISPNRNVRTPNAPAPSSPSYGYAHYRGDDYLPNRSCFAEESRLRIIQDNLICVNGLSNTLDDEEKLTSLAYFGKYGMVSKVIINSSYRPYSYKPVSGLQAYITYENRLDAAFAICAVDQTTIEGKEVRVTYGTTKYCTHFLKGIQCRNKECFFLHKYDTENELQGGKSGFLKESMQNAIRVIQNNLKFYVDKQKQQQADDETPQAQLPSFKNTLEYLVKRGDVQRSKYQELSGEKTWKKENYDSISTKGSPTKIVEQKEQKKVEERIEKLIIKQIMGKRAIYKSRFEFANYKCSQEGEINRIKCYVRKHLLAEL